MRHYNNLKKYLECNKIREAEELFRSMILSTSKNLYEYIESDDDDYIGGDAADDLVNDVKYHKGNDDEFTFEADKYREYRKSLKGKVSELSKRTSQIENQLRRCIERDLLEDGSLEPTPKVTDFEGDSVNKKSVVSKNAKVKESDAKPVKMKGTVAKGRADPKAKKLMNNVQNAPFKATNKLKKVSTPDNKREYGMNKTSPVPKKK